MTSQNLLRLRKLAFSLLHPGCWRALKRGVAPSVEHRAVVGLLDCDFILDVGANRGQFSLLCRLIKPSIPLIAFEPLESEARIYRSHLGNDPKVQLHQTALGPEAGETEIHVSRSRDSSSLLPIGEMQTRVFSHTEEVTREHVSVRTLDDFEAAWAARSRVLLKLDVQGYELAVLRGASRTLKHCAYVYAECSEVALYVGQALRPEIVDFLTCAGFRQSRRLNEFYEADRLIQADYLFERVIPQPIADS